MMPLRVSCRLAAGTVVSFDGLFPLDSILAAEWVRRNHPDKYYNDGAKGGIITPALPLAQTEVNGERIWAASLAQYQLKGEYTHYWHKRLDEHIATEHLDKLRKINTSSAEYKAYRMPVNVMLIPRMTWFCVGDPNGVRELLKGIRSLGKKRSQGFGMVALGPDGLPAWEVEEWPEDWSVWGPGGRLMRVIPFAGKLVPGATVRRWGIRPPGWHRENQVLTLIPEVGDWDETLPGEERF
jgi:CRISPR type IV-associated protein Csf3